MKLIAKKPCSFGGKRFYIGDEIPAEVVLNPQEQEKMGRLSIVTDGAEVAHSGDSSACIPLIVHSKEGDLPISLTAESLQAVVDVLTSNADDAAAAIKEMDDRDSLALLYFADSRKTVQQAAEARARAVDEANAAAETEEESAGEQ